jgi:hypothetical protein
MNKRDIQQASSTSDGIAIIVVLLMTQSAVGQHPKSNICLPEYPPIRIEENSKTFGQYTNSFVEHKHLGVSFEETVASFYEQFLTMQEPLGKEFEQVLHDNLWNLIVRT